MGRRNALGLLRRQGPLVGVLTLAGLLAAIAVVLLQLRQSPQHQATTSLLASTSASTDLARGAAVAENPSEGPLQGVSGIAKSPFLLQPVVDRLALPVTAAQLSEQVSVTRHADEVVLDITVADDSAARAARIADAIADRLVSVLPQLVSASSDGTRALSLTRIRAAHATPPNAPDTVPLSVGGLLLGLVAGLAAAGLREPRREPGWQRLAGH